MTRSTRNILIGLGLGIATGLFLGERARVFQFVAEGYVRLLQMTVLPYIIVSVIAGFGSLDATKAGRLFLRVGILTLVLWGLTLGLVFLLPLAFPTVETASFFSTSLVQERPPLDFISLYIPTNAFQSLANNVVPAVVLFSGFLGIALIGIKEKEPLLSGLLVLEKVLRGANRFAVASDAHRPVCHRRNDRGHNRHRSGGPAAGLSDRLRRDVAAPRPLDPARVGGLPDPHPRAPHHPVHAGRVDYCLHDRRAIRCPGDPSGPFEGATGGARTPEPEEGAPADIIIPTFYNFPHVAKVLSLSFVLFAAWYSDTVVSLSTRVQIALAGIASLFGSINTAMPFLLDLARVPSDTFQLFLATGIINSRFGTLAAAMHMVVLALAGTYAFTGKLRFSSPRILRYCLITVVATAGTLAGISFLLRVSGQMSYDKDQVAMNMQFRHPPSQKAVVLSELPTRAAPTAACGRIRAGGSAGAGAPPRGLHRRRHALQLRERQGRARRL